MLAQTIFKAPNGVVIPFFDDHRPVSRPREKTHIKHNKTAKIMYTNHAIFDCGLQFYVGLKLAAKRGVEVCIITPHKPDKK